MMRLDLIPYRIKIGVSGHRILINPKSLAISVEEILSLRYKEVFTQKAQRAIEKAIATPVIFTIISPLAEGADRLVAKVCLAKGGSLEALLPMPRQEYERDFFTSESRQEFSELIDSAHRVIITDCGVPTDDVSFRIKSYRHVGEETIARSDILIAIWDGKEQKSECGTGAIVDLALQRGKPVFIISTTHPGSVELKNGGILNADFIAELNNFNAFQIKTEQCKTNEANKYISHFQADIDCKRL